MLKIRRASKMTCFIIKSRNVFRSIFLSAVFTTLLMTVVISILQTKNNESNISRNDDSRNELYRELYNAAMPGELLIDATNCKIPNLNPFSSEAMSVFSASDATNCSNISPLTTVKRDSNGVKLIINRSLVKHYLSWWQNEISCCYQQIKRSGSGSNADNQFSLSKCVNFESGHLLGDDDEFLLVTCKGFRNTTLIRFVKTEVYKNAHPVVNTKKSVTAKKTAGMKSSKDDTNVMFIGIDSISRLNLIRAMPATYEHLQENPQWIELKGFNKIKDNTFPNFMAILAGVNESHAFDQCSTKEVGGINKCRFLWDDFGDDGYATAYAEDSMEITTFNFYKKGFLRQPTDYYIRPFALAAERYLKTTHDKPWNTNCVGYQHYADYIYSYAADFAQKFVDSSHFGVFWTNSFSHDNINMPSEYDIRMRNHLKSLEDRNLIDNTIVIFFSDHGMRFGEIRKFFTGWLEERLPFLYIWVPKAFETKHPKLVENLRINSRRLTSPYDVYITAKHILQLSGSILDLTAHSCTNCQSLFHEVPEDRTCEDAGIPDNYCTCTHYKEINHTLPVIRGISEFIVDVLNAELSVHNQKCAILKLHNVLSARESTYNGFTDYLVSINVLPSKGEFEATVRCASPGSYELIGEISRINRYGDQSKCIKDAHLRKYCYCV